MMRRAIAAALAVMIGAAVGQFFYAGLVSRFPQFLVVAAALASGMYLRSWREIALAALLAAIAWQTYETWALRASMLFGLAIMLATTFFQLGWCGAERVFFQRRLRDEPVAVRHLLGLVGPFIGRFFAVGLPFGIVLSGFYFTAFRVHRPVGGPMPGWFHVGAGLCLLGMDFALTFVTPALAYTSRSALRAMGIGFVMIRQTCRSALY